MTLLHVPIHRRSFCHRNDSGYLSTSPAQSSRSASVNTTCDTDIEFTEHDDEEVFFMSEELDSQDSQGTLGSDTDRSTLTNNTNRSADFELDDEALEDARELSDNNIEQHPVGSGRSVQFDEFVEEFGYYDDSDGQMENDMDIGGDDSSDSGQELTILTSSPLQEASGSVGASGLRPSAPVPICQCPCYSSDETDLSNECVLHSPNVFVPIQVADDSHRGQANPFHRVNTAPDRLLPRPPENGLLNGHVVHPGMHFYSFVAIKHNIYPI